jgi:branched-chain amino acid transport system permease protein
VISGADQRRRLRAPAADGAVSRRGRGSVSGAAGLTALVVVLAVLPYVAGPGVTYQLATLFVLVILASMWNLLAGYSGLVSIGLQAFIGIGSYSLLWLSIHGVGVYAAIPLAALISAALALPTAFLVFRLRGGYFAVATWVIAEVALLIVSQITSLGAGSGASLNGLSGYDPAQRQADTYWVTLVLTVATLLGIYLLLRSRLGLGLTAIRDSESAAGSLGVEVNRAKLVAYLIAALGCGAAGAVILANSLEVAPDSAFSVQWTAYMIFCVMVGGLGTIEGPVIGAIIFFALQYWLSADGAWYLILIGVLAIIMTVRFRQGIWGLVAARTGISLFPVGYRVRMSAAAGAGEPAAAAGGPPSVPLGSGGPGGPESGPRGPGGELRGDQQERGPR